MVKITEDSSWFIVNGNYVDVGTWHDLLVIQEKFKASNPFVKTTVKSIGDYNELLRKKELLMAQLKVIQDELNAFDTFVF